MKNIVISKREVSKKNIVNNTIIELNQRNLINQLYLDEEFEGKKQINQELKKKLNSYKTQDKKKKRYDEKLFISLFDIVEKLVISKLKCKYCRCMVSILYNTCREGKQWTLDRIDNSIGHNADNVVIACLQCNLKRRRQDDKKFLFSKQMVIIKKY